jgi:FO synthase
MNESISRAAGAAFGQEMTPEQMEALIRSAGRVPRQRTTLYETAPADRVAASFGAPPCVEPLNPPVKEAGLKAPRQLIRPAAR